MSALIFRSRVCTNEKQSEMLLKLGLKKETADMYRPPSWGGDKIIGYYAPDVVLLNDHFVENPNDLPAWSILRLVEILGDDVTIKEEYLSDSFDFIIVRIENKIKQGLFNKNYLTNEC